MSKFSNILTMILVVLIVAIIGVIGYFAYDTLNAKRVESNALSAIDEFEKSTQKVKRNIEKVGNTATNETNTEENTASLEEIANRLASETEVKEEEQPPQDGEIEPVYYEGYEVKGTIEIPRTKVNYPILDAITRKSLNVAIGLVPYGPGINEVGNTILYGHNFRNGTFFSNNKKLKNGDEVIITDQKGEKVTYVIYDMFQTTANDAEYMTRDTEGRREISLQTCTDDSKNRLIILAAEKGSM